MANYTFHIARYDFCSGAVNSYVIETAHYILLIDTAVSSAKATIESVLRKCSLSEKRLIILNTHGHWDHSSLNSYLKCQYNGLTMAHRDMKDWCNKKQQFQKIYGEYLALHPDDDIHELYMQEFEEFQSPDIGLIGGEKITDDDFCLQVLYTPGHSHDSLSFFEADRGLLIAGDAIQGNGFDGYAPFYCDAPSYMDSISRLLQLNPRSIYCGHGIAEGADAARRMLQDSVEAFMKIDKAICKYNNMGCEATMATAVAREFGYSDSMHILTTVKAHLAK